MSQEHPPTALISSTFNLGESEAVAVDSSAGGLLEGMGLDGDTLAPMETDEPTATDPKAKSKLTPAMATRIKQIKPLLSGEIISINTFFFKFPMSLLSPTNLFIFFQLPLGWVGLWLSSLACW